VSWIGGGVEKRWGEVEEEGCKKEGCMSEALQSEELQSEGCIGIA
jgi:hypothetical protein